MFILRFFKIDQDNPEHYNEEYVTCARFSVKTLGHGKGKFIVTTYSKPAGGQGIERQVGTDHYESFNSCFVANDQGEEFDKFIGQTH